jgi:hypothetical protein
VGFGCDLNVGTMEYWSTGILEGLGIEYGVRSKFVNWLIGEFWAAGFGDIL